MRLGVRRSWLEERGCMEKGIRTVVVPPSGKRKGYQYQRDFGNVRGKENSFRGKNEYILADKRKERFAKTYLLAIMTESFYNYAKENGEEAIKRIFSDKPMNPIMNMPYRFMPLFKNAGSSFVFCGKRTLAVHVHRHNDIPLEVFQDMQKVLNNTTCVYVEKNPTSPNGQKGVAFEVMDFKGERYAIVVRTDKQGKLIFWKSMHIQHNVQGKWEKINLAKRQGLKKSVKDGHPSIYRTSNASSSDLSAFPDSDTIPQGQGKINGKSVLERIEELKKAFSGARGRTA